MFQAILNIRGGLRSVWPCKRSLAASYRVTFLKCAAQFYSTKPRIGSDYVVHSPHCDVQIPTEDIYTMITKDFPRYGPKTGLVDSISGKEYSYNEIVETTEKFSSGLRHKFGFAKGDVLGIAAPNCPEYAMVYLGTLAAGGVVTTCNPTHRADELAYQFKDSGTKVIVTIPAILSTIKKAADKCGIEQIIILDDSSQSSVGNLVSYKSIITEPGSPLDPVHTNPDDVMVLPYSSGTTGLSKGVMLTNKNVISSVLQLSHQDVMSLKENDSKILTASPFFHTNGMVAGLLSSLHACATLVTLPKFEPEMFLSVVEKYKVSFAHIDPSLVESLAKHPLMVDKYDIASIKDMIIGGAPVGSDVVKATCERTKCKSIRQAYGLTETSGVAQMMTRSLGMQIPMSTGPCVGSMKVKVVDPESGEALPPYRKGELWLSGPNIMKGYLNNPKATQKCLTDDGWFKSGDIGYYNENGLFFITDRLKELIKLKSFQVVQAELEELHPKIADAAVRDAGKGPNGNCVEESGRDYTKRSARVCS